ncbi:MAG: glycosyltransferase family 2 protein, partial [Alphaproteobacteria bacterium]
MSHSDPLISVIIPNYNYARYIAATLDSVARQDHGPIELILVDDASNDNSLDVARRVLANDKRFSRIVLIAQPTNKGKLAAINRALEEVQGPYSIILDSDDLLTPHYISRCLSALLAARKAQAHIGFVYTDCYLIDENGKS